MRRHRLRLLLLAILCGTNQLGFASHHDGIHVPVSASWGIGSMQDSQTAFPSRTMGAFSFEALPGYQWQDWFFGVHFDYRLVQQYSSLTDSGDSNWRGNAYFLGLGVRKHWDRFYLQGAVDFLGKYSLNQNTNRNEDAAFKSPIGFAVRVGYAPFESIPCLSAHLGLNYGLVLRSVEV